MHMSEKCKNCGHDVWWDIDPMMFGSWWHVDPRHDDKCDCRKPEPREFA